MFLYIHTLTGTACIIYIYIYIYHWDSNPAVRGRRLDDNVTLPMNALSLAKTQWLLVLNDFLCVRTDEDGRRTSKIGEVSYTGIQETGINT